MKISPKVKKWAIISGLVLSSLVALLVLILIGALVFLQTEGGQNRLAGMISSLASSEDMKIELKGLSGRIPWTIQLESLRLADREGVWLSAEGFEAEWKAGALLDGQINLPRIYLHKVTLARTPHPAETTETEAQPPAEKKDIKTILDELKLPNLTVGELVIDEVALTPPLSSPETRFSVKGRQVMDGRSAALTLSIERLDGPPDHLTLKVDLAGDPSVLTVGVDMSEEPGGLLGRLSGLPQSGLIRLGLNGSGPISDWNGALSLSVQDMLAAEADIGLVLTDPFGLKLKGEAQVDPAVLPEKAAEWSGRGLEYDLEVSLIQNRHLTLKHLDLNTVKAALAVKGGADLAEETFEGEFTITAKDLSKVRELAGVDLEDRRVVKGNAHGPFKQPEISISTDLGSLAYDVYSIENASLSLDISPAGPLGSDPPDLAARGQLRLAGILTPLQDLAPDQLDITFDLGTRDMKKLILNNLALDGGFAQVQVSGDLSLDSLETACKIKIDRLDLAHFKSAGLDFQGAASLEANVIGALPDDIRLDFLGQLADLKGLPKEATLLMGSVIDFSGSAAYTPEALNLSDVFIQGNSQVALLGRLDLKEKAMDLDYRVDLGSLPALVSQYGIRSGPAEVKGKITGPFSAMNLDLGLNLGKVTAFGQVYSGIGLQAKMSGLPSEIKGAIALKANAAGLDLDVKTNLAMKNERLILQKLNIQAPGTSLAGNLTYNLKNGMMDGQVRLGVVNLHSLSRFTGRKMLGKVAFEVKVSPEKGKQGVAARGNVKNLEFGAIKAETIAVRANIGDLKNALATAKIRVGARKLDTGGLALKSVDAALNSETSGGRFQVKAAGNSGHEFQFNTSGSFTSGKRRPLETLTLKTLEAKYANYPLKLVRPVALTLTQDGFEVENLDITLQRGRLTGSGKMDARTVSLNLCLKEMPLSPINLFSPISIKGTIDGNLQITGPPSGPEVKTNLKVSGNVIPGQGFQGSPPLDIDLDATLRQGTLNAEVKIAGLGDAPGTAKVNLPARLSLKPFAFDVPPTGRLSGKLDMLIDLKRVPAFLALDGQTLTGEAKLDFTATGSVSKIVASGQASVSNAYYENVRLGIIIKDIAAQINANGTKVQLASLRMSDGERGSITAQGGIDLDARQKFPFNMNMNLNQMKLVRLDIFTTTTNGTVQMTGNTEQAGLKSDITFDPTEVKIPKNLPTQVANVSVKQLNTKEKPKKKKEKSQSPPTNLSLDVGLHFPARFFVRGDGINTEWQGSLQITGTAAQPKISGGLSAVRGHYELLGKRFVLTQGTLSFTNSNPPSPLFSITGSHKAKDIVAIITVSGSPSSPKLEMSSEPVLPQDEILARVLFGKKLSNISAMQAIKLAQAANELSGGNKPSLDLLGKTRDALGLDQLEIKQGESGSTAIGAGKYISDRVYVEAEGGMKPEDQKVSVEIELSPSISLESEVGADSQGAVGLYWKKDY